jgi:hypothetical protein
LDWYNFNISFYCIVIWWRHNFTQFHLKQRPTDHWARITVLWGWRNMKSLKIIDYLMN